MIELQDGSSVLRFTVADGESGEWERKCWERLVGSVYGGGGLSRAFGRLCAAGASLESLGAELCTSEGCEVPGVGTLRDFGSVGKKDSVCGASGTGVQREGSNACEGVVAPGEDGGSAASGDGVDVAVGCLKRGKNYEKNKAKRERAKVLKAGVRGLRDVCPSLTGSVRTVDTRTAEEIEAVRTLASRRVAENKVARKMAELKLVSLNNKDKTDAVLRLEAARMEQRINEAKAKSQASFKECDTSLKSLGSTGSAGEFALKQEVKRGRDNEIRLKYAQLQNDYMIKHVPEHVRQVILDMPEPVFEHDAEVFGECPEDYDDEQRMAYDIEMNSRAAGVQY